MFQLTKEFSDKDSVREWYEYLRGNNVPCGIAQRIAMFSVWRTGKFKKTIVDFKGERTVEKEDVPCGKLRESCHGFEDEWERERIK